MFTSIASPVMDASPLVVSSMGGRRAALGCRLEQKSTSTVQTSARPMCFSFSRLGSASSKGKTQEMKDELKRFMRDNVDARGGRELDGEL
jgi:hypothetical protein